MPSFIRHREAKFRVEISGREDVVTPTPDMQDRCRVPWQAVLVAWSGGFGALFLGVNANFEKKDVKCHPS